MRKLLLLLTIVAACGDPEPAHVDHEDHVHAHHAMFGGTLVEIGDHLANFEVVHDADTGTLTVYVLDGHASNTVRLETPALKAAIEVGGKHIDLALKAVADPLSGETVGDSARFEAQSDALKGAAAFTGTIAEVAIFGKTVKDVALSYDNNEG